MNKSNLTTVVAEGITPMVDAALSALEFVPGLGIAVGFLKTVDDLSNRIFVAKLHSFLDGLGQQSEDKILMMKGKFSDPEERLKMGETLLLTIESYTALAKCELLGKLYLAYLHEFLTNSEFRRIALAVNRAFLDDLQLFLTDVKPDTFAGKGYLFDMEHAGLASSSSGFGGGQPVINALGLKMRSALATLDTLKK